MARRWRDCDPISDYLLAMRRAKVIVGAMVAAAVAGVGAVGVIVVRDAPVAADAAPATTIAFPNLIGGVPPTSTAAPTTTVAPAITVPPATGAPAPPSTEAPAPPAQRPTLRRGATGWDVVALQERLQGLHVAPYRVDGKFGEDTEFAVWAFQKWQGLAPTGVVDDDLWARLDHPAPFVSHDPYADWPRVEIDIERQLVSYWDGAALVMISHASTGRPGMDTVPGSFAVKTKVRGWQRVEFGVVYNPLWFHGNAGLHGFSSVPTRAASHGCVRIPIDTANLIFPIIPVGTQVNVF